MATSDTLARAVPAGPPAGGSRRAHAWAVLALGLPLVGSHVAQFAVGMTDTLMLGWYSVEALAAGTLATTIFFVALIAGSGFAFAVTPLVAEAAARGDHRAARRAARMGLWLSAAYGVALTPPLLMGETLLRLLGQPEPVVALGGAYLRIAAWGLIPALLVMVLKSHLAAIDRTRIVLLATIAAALVNAGINWLLIFGRMGFPEMGVRGAAVASLGVHVVSLVVLGAAAMRALPGPPLLARLWRVDRAMLARVARLGWPIGLTNLAEVSMFAGASVMMGWLGTVPLAAHGVAMQLAGAAFMIPLGLSQAATVRAGAALGRGDREELARGGRVAIAVAGVAAGLVAVVFVAIPETLVALFVSPDEPARAVILAAGATLVLVAAAFHVVDAAQVMALGLLRGVQDTTVPMVMAAVSYWLVGFPAAHALGFWAGLGGPGVWAGLGVGLAAAGVLMMGRFWGPVLRGLASAQRLAEAPDPGRPLGQRGV